MNIHESVRQLVSQVRRGSGDNRSRSDPRRGSGDKSRHNSVDTSPHRHGGSGDSQTRTRLGSSSTLPRRSLENIISLGSRSNSRERLISNSDTPPSPLSPLIRNIAMFGAPPGSPTLPRTAATSTVPHQGLSSKNNEWTEVQTALVTLFQRKKLPDNQLSFLLITLRKMVKSEVGGFIYDFYKNQLMKKGMQILRNSLQSEGEELLQELGDLWDCFFRETLPTLQMLLFPIETMELPIRNLTLIGFRDNVVLKKDLEEILIEVNSSVPPSIRQMLLVLQGIHDDDPPNENYLKLERLVGCVITPHIGYKGVYMECQPEPTIKAYTQAYRKKSSGSKEAIVIAPNPSQLNPMYQRSQSVDFLSQSPLQASGPQRTRRNMHIRQASTPAGIILEPLVERVEAGQDHYHRRHSIACEVDVFDNDNENQY
ncbi:proline-rich protein 5-like isoform X2 [Lineus longissimus]|uniref:proline-rich protein 5-like isoform X2 n=1 Tax=Lineus longissimus TaxID=88925 RepID=UPI00315C8612